MAFAVATSVPKGAVDPECEGELAVSHLAVATPLLMRRSGMSGCSLLQLPRLRTPTHSQVKIRVDGGPPGA